MFGCRSRVRFPSPCRALWYINAPLEGLTTVRIGDREKRMRSRVQLAGLFGTIVLIVVITSCSAEGRQAARAAAGQTQVVLLGTGTPRPDPDRSGPATAIVVNNRAYLVDAGPGLVRRAQAAFDKGIRSLAVTNLTTAFITHLHSDHTVGYRDLIFTTWVQGRTEPLKVYGPAGTEAMTSHIMQAWDVDINVRTTGLEQRSTNRLTVNAHDIKPGVVFEDKNVKVTAFPTPHGELPQSFGYRFQTADRTIVISGDTSPGSALVENCRKCDVLIHEAYSEKYQPADMPNWLQYRPKYHTTTSQLAEIANKTQPGLLILYHRGVGPRGREISDEQYLAEVHQIYRGAVVVARDLDVY
jgi:ribonuclease BN (tRNA processing enzyme)